jgi:anti-sigma factor RsiW
MDCERVQEEILESLIEPCSAAVQAIVDAHLITCSRCAAFAARQARVDEGLRAALVPPGLNRRLRAVIRERIRLEPSSAWPDMLPDAVHFASCGVVTVVSLVFLPFSPSVVLSTAAVVTMISHAVLTAVEGAWDAADDLS